MSKTMQDQPHSCNHCARLSLDMLTACLASQHCPHCSHVIKPGLNGRSSRCMPGTQGVWPCMTCAACLDTPVFHKALNAISLTILAMRKSLDLAAYDDANSLILNKPLPAMCAASNRMHWVDPGTLNHIMYRLTSDTPFLYRWMKRSSAGFLCSIFLQHCPELVG